MFLEHFQSTVYSSACFWSAFGVDFFPWSSVDPVRDMDVINLELILADLAQVSPFSSSFDCMHA